MNVSIIVVTIIVSLLVFTLLSIWILRWATAVADVTRKQREFIDERRRLLRSDLRTLRSYFEQIQPTKPYSVVEHHTVRGIWIGDALLTPALHVVIYVHGGGYIYGSARMNVDVYADVVRAVNTHSRTQEHNDAINCRMLSVEYSLSPEAKFPVAIDEIVSAYRYVHDELHIDSRRIILMGTGAGGALVLAACQVLNQRGMLLPASLVLLSPWVDVSTERPSRQLHVMNDVLTPAFIRRCLRDYLNAQTDVTSPLVSPYNADVTAVPQRMFVNGGGRELMIDDIDAFVVKAAVSRLDVVQITAPLMVHEYAEMPVMTPAFDHAQRAIIEYIVHTFQADDEHEQDEHAISTKDEKTSEKSDDRSYRSFALGNIDEKYQDD